MAIEKFLKNLNISSTVNVEFEELLARFVSEDKSAKLCNDSIHVCMKPKIVEKSPPVCLICVVDISGSMGCNCASNVENMESVYISRLTLVKHSIKTIISSLRKEDMISIIVFGDRAEMIVQPTITKDKKAKDEIIESIETIDDCGCTNMWDGIRMAIDTSASIPYDKYQKSIMVFTDGQSNEDPPEGIYQALKNKLDTCNDKFTISTFSFGNGIEPELLVDIAKLGNGIYGYCPDGTMVGTIFINYMANLLSTLTSIIKVNLIQNNKIKETQIIGPLYRGVYRNAIFSEIDKDSLDNTKITIELPMTNQTIEVPLNKESVDLSQFLDEKEKEMEEMKQNEDGNDSDSDDELLDEESGSEDTAVVLDNIDTNIIIDEKDDALPLKYEEILLNQILRYKFVNTLNKIIEISNSGRDQDAQTILNEYFDLLNQLKYKNKFVNGLLIDIKNPDPNHGQVEKAIDMEYYESWGKCYLYSFSRFQEFEQCGNFKDQSLQYYTHKVFNVYREMANTIFANLPPPKTEERPTYSSYSGGTRRTSSGRLAVARASANPVSMQRIRMRNFINPNGGCFDGDAIVLLEDGSSKRVRDLKKGDRLRNHAIVQCLIEQRISNTNKLLSQQPMMCSIHGVLFTPYHPVKVEDQWYFPVDLVQPKPIAIDAWFNLILKDDTHKKYEVEFENGISAITLGHYRKENKVLEHPYFGTDLVLKDLEERDPEGYSNGYIYIKELHCRQLQYDENNQYCINYYKIPTDENNMITNSTNKIEILDNAISNLIY